MRSKGIEEEIMRIILLIAFRNLFRQKSRSILIGSGICVAVIYMILINALTEGLYSNVINKMVESNIMGHITLNIIEKDGSTGRAIIRDMDAMISMIKGKYRI
jgi:ABC-type lipoprotein release transport system permease subunit